jgi:hypothetical protein
MRERAAAGRVRTLNIPDLLFKPAEEGDFDRTTGPAGAGVKAT